jgi:N-formylglutamate deformylase
MTAAGDGDGDLLLSSPVIRLVRPAGPLVPVVFDSPHSGCVYPPDFQPICSPHVLRGMEDASVDELVRDAPHFGIPLLSALFPRSYVDVNRAADDLDPALFDGEWDGPLAPSEKSRAGMGLIRSRGPDGSPLYAAPLPVAAIRARLDFYYHPYHAALADLLDAAHRQFGFVFHLNCHSMPSRSQNGRKHPDFVIGDRDGTTAEPGFLAVVFESLRAEGYSVAYNAPYKGQELIRRHGRPQDGRYSLQMEINRALYMNESTLEKTSDFKVLQQNLRGLLAEMAAYVTAFA